MRVIVCLDEKGGMLFNRRRKSRDRAVIADILRSVGDWNLYLSPYSEKLFADAGVSYTADENFLALAGKGDVCFVEDRHLSEWAERIDEVVIYHWNRRYPADFYFDLSLSELGFSLREVSEWQGYSHKKITKEIFAR